MKSYVVIFMLVIGVTWADHIHDDGQPGCKTPEELQIRNFRNNWDPTVYWACVTLNEPAIREKCPHGTGWLDSKKACVEWPDWDWEEPKEPPSRP